MTPCGKESATKDSIQQIAAEGPAQDRETPATFATVTGLRDVGVDDPILDGA